MTSRPVGTVIALGSGEAPSARTTRDVPPPRPEPEFQGHRRENRHRLFREVIMDRQQPMGPSESPRPQPRVWIARAFTGVEDVVYIGLGLLLAGGAAHWQPVSSTLKRRCDRGCPSYQAARSGFADYAHRRATLHRSGILSQALTAPEPFLIVGLISAIRRVLILTAEFGELHENGEWRAARPR